MQERYVEILMEKVRNDRYPSGDLMDRIEGTIVGGTGRYEGAVGTYSFSWQYTVEGEDGAVQSRAVGLRGRVRVVPQPNGGGR